ncbi:hypothetical protein P43SY_002370 [Pythium insidiosum]|uniref:Uncharacterized protein n=1 Tax=Pythium insidiosum TaxID=114742 RepID=A0AAD5LQS2_PYTIN|nr:hypothetical protein P43SY_002370 [Pythium insidiosum]
MQGPDPSESRVAASAASPQANEASASASAGAKTAVQRAVAFLGFVFWVFTTLNAVIDPAKTVYGYYIHSDSDNQEVVWSLIVSNQFENGSAARPCEYPIDSQGFLGCYFELPVYGTGSLAGAHCRSFYPTDKGAFQHIGNFFGNCTLSDGSQLHLPSEQFATTQWTVQTSSHDKPCLELLGEGEVFACDSYTTMNGRVINHRASRTEATKWCREFGGYYVNDLALDKQQVLVANASFGAEDLAFTSIPLDLNRPVFNLYDMLGCSVEMHIGGVPTHISTSAFYGPTMAPWSARTTRSARRNAVSRQANGLYLVETYLHAEGDLTLVRTWFKDLLRLTLLGLVVCYRTWSIYYPMFLVYERQHESFMAFAITRGLGIVIHKRERRSLLVLALLSLETLMSTEDIVMFCQQIIYTSRTSYVRLVLNYMSIARIVWPAAFVIAAVSRLLRVVLPRHFTVAVAEDLFLIACPIVWAYIPSYVTKKGMLLFQGYKWGGAIVHHYANSIQNVYDGQVSHLSLYYNLFGYFTAIAAAGGLVIGAIVHYVSHGASLLVWLYSGGRRLVRDADSVSKIKSDASVLSLERVLVDSTLGISDVEAKQITRAKIKRQGVVLCEGFNVAADGFLCLVYGPYQVLGSSHWGYVAPIRNREGHVARISDCSVAFDAQVTTETLAAVTSTPTCLGLPDLI